MLNIPFLNKYIEKIVKEQTVADSADWLNYYCTSLMLAFFSLAISAKQYFGSAIKCWTPNEFGGGWTQYAEDYCFIANSYYVPDEDEIPMSNLSMRTDRISYYRWVPILLAVQALMFWLPNWLWNMIHKQTAVNPRSIVSEAIRSREAVGVEREKEVEKLASYIVDVLSVFHYQKRSKKLPCSGFNATTLYLGIKLLYVLNVIGQLVLLNRFLGGEYLSWGYEQFSDLVNGQEWKESPIFPRVIMCDFVIRRMANAQRHTIQCVIMMNMINEKLYFFLYFWLIFVGVTTLVNFFYYFLALSLPFLRTKFVLYNISRKEQKEHGMTGRDLNRFVQRFLRPDGVLLLQFIRQHVGGRVTYDLLNELLRIYYIRECRQCYDDDVTTTKSSPLSDKTPHSGSGGGGTTVSSTLTHRGSGGDGNGRSANDTYKPTQYGPSGLYPAGDLLLQKKPSSGGQSGHSAQHQKRQPSAPNDYVDFIDAGLPSSPPLSRETVPDIASPYSSSSGGSGRKQQPTIVSLSNADTLPMHEKTTGSGSTATNAYQSPLAYGARGGQQRSLTPTNRTPLANLTMNPVGSPSPLSMKRPSNV